MEISTKSPCTLKCRLEDGVCSGCYRTIEEIKNWMKMSDSEKIAINLRLARESKK